MALDRRLFGLIAGGILGVGVASMANAGLSAIAGSWISLSLLPIVAVFAGIGFSIGYIKDRRELRSLEAKMVNEHLQDEAKEYLNDEINRFEYIVKKMIHHAVEVKHITPEQCIQQFEINLDVEEYGFDQTQIDLFKCIFIKSIYRTYGINEYQKDLALEHNVALASQARLNLLTETIEAFDVEANASGLILMFPSERCCSPPEIISGHANFIKQVMSMSRHDFNNLLQSPSELEDDNTNSILAMIGKTHQMLEQHEQEVSLRFEERSESFDYIQQQLLELKYRAKVLEQSFKSKGQESKTVLKQLEQLLKQIDALQKISVAEISETSAASRSIK